MNSPPFVQRFGSGPECSTLSMVNENNVDDGEDVGEAVGGDRQGPHQVHMHVAESTLRDGDGLDWSCWLLLSP